MKKLFLYLSLLLVIPLFSPVSKAADIYFAQTAAGAGNGTSCANAYAWTDGTHGINVAASWSPGNRLHLCGTISVPTHTAGIVAQASGTSVSPIQVICETNCILQSPQFNGCADGPVSGSFSAGGAVNINGFNNIIVDGGTNGIIQNTANGTGLTNATCSLGFNLRGDNLIFRNWTVRNIYQRTSMSADTAGGSTADGVVGGNSTFVMVCNNVLDNASLGLELNFGGSSTTPATSLPSCQSNTFTSGTFAIFNNTTVDHNWQMVTNGTGAPLIFSNDMSGWSNWWGNAIFHQDGIFNTGHSNTTYNPQFFWNYFHGDFCGGGQPTGFLYFTDTGSTDGTGQSGAAYRNIFYGTGNNINCGQVIAFQSTTGDPKGPYKILNNTTVNSQYALLSYLNNGGTPIVDHRNNIYWENAPGQGGSGGAYFGQANNGHFTFSTLTSNGNDYFGGRTAAGLPPLAFGLYLTLLTFNGTPPNYLTDCNANGGTECDSNSITLDPLLSGESNFATGGAIGDLSGFYLTSSSPVRSIGDNLTSQCASLVGLCKSPPQFVGAAGSCGSGCISQTNSSFDAGAFPFSGSTSYWTPDLTAVSSGPTFRTFSWTGFPEGKGTTLDSSAVGQYVTFTVNVATAGTYDVKYSTKEYSTRGIAQLSINGTNVGAAQDQYAPCCGTYVTYDLGNYNFATAGNYSFKFTVTGKNASSTDYTMAWDDIILQ
jgi:hypothetical protein